MSKDQNVNADIFMGRMPEKMQCDTSALDQISRSRQSPRLEKTAAAWNDFELSPTVSHFLFAFEDTILSAWIVGDTPYLHNTRGLHPIPPIYVCIVGGYG